MIVKTPKPPYYVVIFCSILDNSDGYSEMADYMVDLAKQQDGFLGIESVRDGLGITLSYWKDVESIKKWKENTQHKIAQEKGKSDWYKSYITRIAKVERDYGFDKENVD